MVVPSAMRPVRPQSVKELVAQAENFTFNNNIPLKHWTRAAETLYQEVSATPPTLQPETCEVLTMHL
jgi:hypothetical protein